MAALLVTPVKDTVWWNTPGGKVLERRDATGASCSLMVYNDAGSVVFEWTDPAGPLVTAIDWNWQFPEDRPMPVAIQVGDQWLSTGADSAVIPAVGHGNTVSFIVNKPVEDLLTAADHVEVRTTSADLSISLNPTKVGVLLSHLRLCREAIRR